MSKIKNVPREITAKKVGDNVEMSYVYSLTPEDLTNRKAFIEKQLQQLDFDLEVISARKEELTKELAAVVAVIEGQ